jgi:hypothetical protein
MLMVAGLLILAIAPSFALIKWSRLNDGQQIWITADSYAARSTDGGSANFATVSASKWCLGGSKTFNFDSSTAWMNGLDPTMAFFDMAYYKDWWVEYTIPTSAVPADFNLNDLWNFYGRVTYRHLAGDTDPSLTQFDCDVVIANGDDFDKDNPTNDDWQAAAYYAVTSGISNPSIIWNTAGTSYDNFSYPYNNHYSWKSDFDSVVVKSLAVHGGAATFRIYPREYGHWSPQVDVILLTNSAGSYSPGLINSDKDFQTANTGSGDTGAFVGQIFPVIAGTAGDGEYWKLPFTVEFTSTTTGKLVYTEVVPQQRLNWGCADIYFCTSMNVPVGTYDIRVSAGSSLKHLFAGVTIPADYYGFADPFNIPGLINGDLNGDNKINALDIVPVKSNWGLNGQ